MTENKYPSALREYFEREKRELADKENSIVEIIKLSKIMYFQEFADKIHKQKVVLTCNEKDPINKWRTIDRVIIGPCSEEQYSEGDSHFFHGEDIRFSVRYYPIVCCRFYEKSELGDTTLGCRFEEFRIDGRYRDYLKINSKELRDKVGKVGYGKLDTFNGKTIWEVDLSRLSKDIEELNQRSVYQKKELVAALNQVLFSAREEMLSDEHMKKTLTQICQKNVGFSLM